MSEKCPHIILRYLPNTAPSNRAWFKCEECGALVELTDDLPTKIKAVYP